MFKIFMRSIITNVNRTIIGTGKLHSVNYEEKTLLITDFVTPPIAELLKESDIPFIDTAGNAFI